MPDVPERGSVQCAHHVHRGWRRTHSGADTISDAQSNRVTKSIADGEPYTFANSLTNALTDDT